jgi:hypothetical protein
LSGFVLLDVSIKKIVLPSSHPFAGIAEKMNRAQENILNLQAEIARFFEESEYPVLSHDNKKIIPEAVEYHSKLPIPLRFSVLSGEVVHHLRSCLDHIVWHFSDADYRRKHITQIQFPILKERPAPADMLAKYERKIKGITDTRVLELIERVQPYNPSPGSLNSLLLPIHNLDIVDKHRTLVIVASTGAFVFPIGMMHRAMMDERDDSTVAADFIEEFKRNGKLVPQVAFDDVGGGKQCPVVQSLGDMYNHVIQIIAAFDKLL